MRTRIIVHRVAAQLETEGTASMATEEALRYEMGDPADEAGIVLCAEEDEEGITSWEVSFSGEIIYDNEEDAERARQEYALAIHQNLLARSPLPTQAEVEEAIANLLLARIESPPSDCDNYIASALQILQHRVPADRRHGTPDQPAPVNRWARLEAGAKALSLGVVFQGGGLHDTPQYDVADAALRYARGESGPLDRVAAAAPIVVDLPAMPSEIDDSLHGPIFSGFGAAPVMVDESGPAPGFHAHGSQQFCDRPGGPGVCTFAESWRIHRAELSGQRKAPPSPDESKLAAMEEYARANPNASMRQLLEIFYTDAPQQLFDIGVACERGELAACPEDACEERDCVLPKGHPGHRTALGRFFVKTPNADALADEAVAFSRSQHRKPQPWTSCTAWTEGHSERAEQQAIANRDTQAACHPAPTPTAILDDSPIPMVLHCPECKTRHVDEGEFATKVHHTHACQGCGLTWRPAVVATVGVQFLPGFKNSGGGK